MMASSASQCQTLPALAGPQCTGHLWIVSTLGAEVRTLGAESRTLGAESRTLGTGHRCKAMIFKRFLKLSTAKTLKTY